MNVKCLFGHKWDGCQCGRCQAIRDTQHEWDKDCESCAHCGKIRVDAHKWNGCRCLDCGKNRSIRTWLSDCDQMLSRLKRGEKLSELDKDACDRAHMAFYDELCAKNGTKTNYHFAEEDRVDFYVSAMKLALICPKKHNGWPTISGIRKYVLDGLKRRLKQKEDPFLAFCAIFSAIPSNDFEYALKSYKDLEEHDKDLAKAARWYLQKGVKLRDSKDPCDRVAYHEGYGKLLEAIHS